MKRLKVLVLVFCALLGSVFVTSCDDSDSSESQSAVIERGPYEIVYINYGRSQIVLEDGWTLDINGNTKISVQRPSCSGFEYGRNLFDIKFEGTKALIEYKIDMTANTTSVPDKEAIAISVTAYRESCLKPDAELQYILDSDLDGYTDNIDAFPNDPTKN